MDRVGIRQTNVDLIAQYVHTAAQPGDLILVNPWYVGITFNRYYRGPVPWMTLPPMEDLTVHRYDLLKLRMTSAEPLAPLYGAIQGALESRHRVWLVGGLLFPPAGPPGCRPAPSRFPRARWRRSRARSPGARSTTPSRRSAPRGGSSSPAG